MSIGVIRAERRDTYGSDIENEQKMADAGPAWKEETPRAGIKEKAKKGQKFGKKGKAGKGWETGRRAKGTIAGKKRINCKIVDLYTEKGAYNTLSKS